MNDKIKAYRDRYITGYEYTRAAQAIKSDLDFLSELVQRNKRSNFDFDLVLNKHGNINGHFLRAFWGVMWPYYTEANIEEYLICYNVTLAIIDNLNYNDLDVSELLDWASIVNDYYEFNILDYVGSFVGGSWQCEAIDAAINKQL